MRKKSNNRNQIKDKDFIGFSGLNNIQVLQQKKDKHVNIVTCKCQRTFCSIIYHNLFSFLHLLVLIVAIFIIYLEKYGQLFFIVTNFINFLIGVVQEIRAKRILDKVSFLMSNTSQVIRDNMILTINSEEIVLDDFLYLESGQQISVDAQVKAGFIEVDESLLSGESNLVPKKKGDLLFSGSYVFSGKACAQVTKVGDATYIQNISQEAKKYNKIQTPLMRKLSILVRVMIFTSVIMTFLLFCLYSSNSIFNSNHNTTDYYVHLCGMTIGMLPTGVFLLVSLTLTLACVRLAKKKIFVQDFFAIEALSQIDILCFDKTGTITDGKMVVKELIEYRNLDSLSLTKSIYIGQIILQMVSMQNNANATNDALINKFSHYQKISFPYKTVDKVYFSSIRKYSAIEFDQLGTFFLGSPEFILQNDFSLIQKEVEKQFCLGYRVLVLAKSNFKLQDNAFIKPKEVLSLIIIEENIKNDIFTTIDFFKQNGVAMKIISGDNHLSLVNIAAKVGITENIKAISLENVRDEDIKPLALKYNIFGRATPQQKKFLINAFKQEKFKVGMIGDGINDILAFKVANVSIAMGSGSSVTRNLANVVLLDSDFSYVPNLVSEGRRVINHLKKTMFLFFTKTLFAFLLGLVVILTVIFSIFSKDTKFCLFPILPLWLNLIDICFIGVPSFFLSLEKDDKIIKDDYFLTTILQRSLPFAFLVILNYLCLLFVADIAGVLLHFVLNFFIFIVFFALLFQICRPLNKWKVILLIGMLFSYFLLFYYLIFEKAIQLKNLLSVFNPKNLIILLILLLCNLVFIFGFSFIQQIIKKLINMFGLNKK